MVSAKLDKLLNSLKGLKDAKAFSLIQNNPITVRNLVVAVGTYGLERILNAKAFNCPEKRYQQYGFTFIFAPVIILFCVNVLVIGEVWKLSSRMCVERYKRHGDCMARVVPSLLKACVGPAVWMIVTFLEEDYYLCAKLGPSPGRGNETSELETVEWRQKVEECKSLSHIWAWTVLSLIHSKSLTVLVALVALGSALVIWKKCFLKDNLLIHNHYAYERREALSAMKTFTEHMSPGASFKYEDAELDKDPGTAEYGGEDEKIKFYKDGLPEMIGRKTVEKLFEGSEDWKYGDEWHYIKAFEAFKKMYPRISTGRPLDPWRAVQRDVKGTQMKTTKPWQDIELEPLNSERPGHDYAGR